MSRTLVLDAEAVSALARRQKGMGERLEAALRGDHRVVVPSLVLAEVMTGKTTDAAVWNVVKRLPSVSIDARIAARAGALRERAESVRRTKRDLTVDAVVASVAVEVAPAVVVTADPKDLEALLVGHDVRISAI